MWPARADFRDGVPASPAPVACPELEAVIRHALNVWAAARDRGGLTARGTREVGEALDAVAQVVELFAAEGRVAANAPELAAARSAAQRATDAIRRYAAADRPADADTSAAPASTARSFAGALPLPAAAAPMTPPARPPVIAPSPALDPARLADAPARALVVDDDRAHRDTLVRLLTLCGHEASAAPDGQAALDALRTAPPPDLVLLDMMMPGLTGADVLKAMGRDPVLCGVPVVVYSAAHEPDVRQVALDLGAREYLVKARAGLDEIQAAIARYARAA